MPRQSPSGQLLLLIFGGHVTAFLDILVNAFAPRCVPEIIVETSFRYLIPVASYIAIPLLAIIKARFPKN